LAIDRKSIYYQRIQEQKDLNVKKQIEEVHRTNPSYGHRRIAIALGIGNNTALRIMRKYAIKPPRRKIKKLYLTRSVTNHSYTNLIKEMIPTKPHQIFVSDLTYIKFMGRHIYLVTIEDIFTREIISAEVSDKHDSTLVLKTLKNAINKYNACEIFHCDQGSEFMAQVCTSFLEMHGVKISVSDKASPWQNGYKESFFGRFKEENGDLNRFETLGELVEEIYSYLYYYNNVRIHTKLKTNPIDFKNRYTLKVTDNVS